MSDVRHVLLSFVEATVRHWSSASHDRARAKPAAKINEASINKSAVPAMTDMRVAIAKCDWEK